METVLLKIELTIKTVVDNLIDLLFAPIWCLYNIVTQTIEVWQSEVESDDEEEEDNKPKQPEHHIGFHQ